MQLNAPLLRSPLLRPPLRRCDQLFPLPLLLSSPAPSIQSVSSVASCAPVVVLLFVSLGVTILVFSFDRYVLLVFSKCFHSPITGSGTKFYSCGVCVKLHNTIICIGFGKHSVFRRFRKQLFSIRYFHEINIQGFYRS